MRPDGDLPGMRWKWAEMIAHDGQWLTLSDGFMVSALEGQLIIDPWCPDTVRDITGVTTGMLNPEQKREIAEFMIGQWMQWGGIAPEGFPI